MTRTCSSAGAFRASVGASTCKKTTQMIETLRARLPGLVVLAAHDPGSAARLAAANRAAGDDGKEAR